MALACRVVLGRVKTFQHPGLLPEDVSVLLPLTGSSADRHHILPSGGGPRSSWATFAAMRVNVFVDAESDVQCE